MAVFTGFSVFASGKKVGLLAGREEQELRWMAPRLRRVMNVPARQPEAPIANARRVPLK